MKTYVDKSKSFGWRAKTVLDVGPSPKEENRRLEITISTQKQNGVVTTIASVGHAGDNMVMHAIFEDYHKRLEMHPDIKRVTEKKISETHQKMLEKYLEPVKKEVMEAYYGG